MNKFLASLGVILLSLCPILAQNTYDQDILKMLDLNGSTQVYDVMYNQMLLQMKMGNASVPDSVWALMKTEVFDEKVRTLTQQIVLVYKKHFTHDDVKGLIAFYDSDLGKKMANKTPLVTQESMMLGQQWGMGLNMAIQSFLGRKVM